MMIALSLNGVNCRLVKNTRKERHTHIGPKMKFSFIFIWSHLMFLTWLMLQSKMHVYLQAISLTITIVSIYIHIILMQDYFYLKTHLYTSKFRKDVRLLEPLIPERFKKHDK